MTILEKIKFEEDWLSEVNLTKENMKIALEGIRATVREQQQQPCDDCISRAEALRHRHLIYDDDGVGYSVVRVDEIEQLPSVTPKQKVGKWIDDGWYAEGHSEHAYRCSECDEHYIGYVGEYNYCPNCGSYNGGEKE